MLDLIFHIDVAVAPGGAKKTSLCSEASGSAPQLNIATARQQDGSERAQLPEWLTEKLLVQHAAVPAGAVSSQLQTQEAELINTVQRKYFRKAFQLLSGLAC